MAAGLVTITIKDGAGTSRNFQMWSDDGTAAGNLSPAAVQSLPAGSNVLGGVTISGTVPLPTGAATSAKQDAIIAALGSPMQDGGSVTIGGSLPGFASAPTVNLGTLNGAALETTQAAANVLVGAVTETAPATDTASSGLNGRLQRIAQRLSSLITAIGSPFQAGGSIGNTAFGATQSGTWNITNVSGTISLPTGAATSAKQDALLTALTPTEYETVAASQTDQALGATGATGDLLVGVLIIPATTSPGAVSIKDGSGSAITVFTGGDSSVSGLVPFFVPLGIKSTGGAWKVTTGANVSAIGVGDFS